MRIDPPDIATPRVLFDLSRLLRMRGRPFPTGVDRIDLAIGRSLVERFGADCLFVHASAGGPALIPHAAGAALIEALHRRWNGLGDPPSDTLRVAVEVAAGRARAILGGARMLAQAKTTYVNASHSGLPLHRGALDRLDPDRLMHRFAYVHDLIPIDLPEYQRPGTDRRFLGFLDEIAAAPVCFATNSAATRHRLERFAAARSWAVEGLAPLVPRLDRREATPAMVPGSLRPAVRRLFDGNEAYFIVIGTIEPRKNHLLLLQIWRDLAAHGTPPKLVVVGRRGWENEMVVDLLERSTALAPHVAEFGDLTDIETQALMQRARALLLPSFAEGLGLPVMEAALLGVPAIVSDLPALREIAAPGTVFLDPLDGLGWRREILARS
jgi:glycosyltransferase involved in cell wall biosynthesis